MLYLKIQRKKCNSNCYDGIAEENKSLPLQIFFILINFLTDGAYIYSIKKIAKFSVGYCFSSDRFGGER